MKIYIYVVLLLFITGSVYSQNDSIRKAILNHAESKSVIIFKGRDLLLDKFVLGDYGSVKKIKNYLEKETKGSEYLAFYPVESWVLSYWTEEYQSILDDISNFDEDAFLADMQNKIKPQPDFLSREISSKSVNSLGILETYIKNSQLNNEDKSFLNLHLKSILLDSKDLKVNQDDLNKSADDFFAKYPNSKYEKFIRKYIRFKSIPSNWGFGYELFSGYGEFTDELSTHFSSNIPFGVAFEVSYKKANLYLRDYIGFSKTKHDIAFNAGVWKKGLQANIYIPEISLGYTLIDNDHIKLAPYAGFSGVGITSVQNDIEKDDYLENVKRWSTSYLIGLNLDIKLFLNKNLYSTNYIMLKLRYGYGMQNFDRKYNNYGGNIHFITIGIGQFGRIMKRKL